jgi:hypothetical protein
VSANTLILWVKFNPVKFCGFEKVVNFIAMIICIYVGCRASWSVLTIEEKQLIKISAMSSLPLANPQLSTRVRLELSLQALPVYHIKILLVLKCTGGQFFFRLIAARIHTLFKLANAYTHMLVHTFA